MENTASYDWPTSNTWDTWTREQKLEAAAKLMVEANARRSDGYRGILTPAQRQANYLLHSAMDTPHQPTLPMEEETGQALKAQGQALALNAAGMAEYRSEFNEQLRHLADKSWPFSVEDVTAVVGYPMQRGLAPTNNAVGALMTGAAKRGLIVKVDRVKALRPSSHATEITEWIGAQWRP
jgi:hypothetical protein